MKKLSILIYSLGSGGAERVVSLLIPYLMKEYDVHLILMNDSISFSLPSNLSITYLEKSSIHENSLWKFIKLPFLAYKYKKLCQNNNIAISFSLLSRPNYINLLAKCLGLTSKVIISERSMPSLQYGDNNFRSRVNKILIRSLYPKASKIIANSYGNTNDLIQNFFIKNEKIITIYNPIDIKKIKASILEKVEVSFDKYTFITIGRLDQGKNHKLLIDAFSKLNIENTQLLIIGDGPLRDKLLQDINKKGLQKRVVLLGRQKNPYKFLTHSDCFVFGSNHEGFPNVILEALACELPIISTDCLSGPAEILSPNAKDEFGVLVPTNDTDAMVEAMKKMLKNQDLALRYKNKAKIRANDFNLETIFQQYLKAINE